MKEVKGIHFIRGRLYRIGVLLPPPISKSPLNNYLSQYRCEIISFLLVLLYSPNYVCFLIHLDDLYVAANAGCTAFCMIAVFGLYWTLCIYRPQVDQLLNQIEELILSSNTYTFFSKWFILHSSQRFISRKRTVIILSSTFWQHTWNCNHPGLQLSNERFLCILFCSLRIGALCISNWNIY